MKHLVLSLVAAATLCVPAMAQNRVKNVYTSSSALDTEQLHSTEQTVQLNRFLFAGYNTLCLPMTVSAEQLQAAALGARLERLVGMKQEGSSLCLYFLDCTAEGIVAGTPYLIYAPSNQYLRFRNTEATAVSDNLTPVRLSDAQGNTISFGSSWQTVCKDGLYGIPAKQATTPLESILIRTEADKAFLPTRCGFNWEQQSTTATDLQIRHIKSLDEATGIALLTTPDTQSASAIYDLSGRKLSTAKKGIVIQNGKKVVNRK